MNHPATATKEDADLVAALLSIHDSVAAAGRAVGVPAPRLFVARMAGKGRRLSDPQRERIRDALR